MERAISGFGGKYLINTDGQITRVYPSGHRREIKGYRHRSVFTVNLTGTSGTRSTFHVNRLVWQTFVGPIPKGKLVCRRDNNLTHNQLDNLYLSTLSERGKITGSKGGRKAVEQLESGKVINSWPSARRAAKDLYVSPTTVTDICNKKLKNKPIFNLRWEGKT